MTVGDTVRAAPSEVVDLDTASTSSASDADGLRDEWNRLAAECAGTSYFQTADWVWSWWETVARRPPTRVACWRSAEGSLEAVTALSRGREVLHRRLRVSVPVVTFAGSGPGDADHCGPVAVGARRADVGEWLLTAARHRTLVAGALAEESGVRPAGGRVVQRTVCPRLGIDGGNTGAGPSANFRAQLGRFRRRLDRAGVTFEWHAPGTVERAVVDRLFVLHHSLRRGRALPTSLGDAHHQLLLRCAARGTSGRGPAALVARRGDDVVGVLLGFWWQDCFSAYQSGWDVAYARDSIGSVLVSEAIRSAGDAGARTFDFLRGAEAYKYRFGAVDAYDETTVVPSGVVGALVVAAARARNARNTRNTRKARHADGAEVRLGPGGGTPSVVTAD